MKLISSLGAAAFALLALAGAASAQTAGATDATKIGDYFVRCLPVENASPCDMFQEVQLNGQRVVTMSIAFMPSTNRYLMVISVPHGVLIEKGAVIETSGFNTEVMPFRRCDRGGCYIEALAPVALIDGFAKATGRGKIKLVGDDDKPYEFDLSFNGFGTARDRMVEQNRLKAKTPAGVPAAPAQ